MLLMYCKCCRMVILHPKPNQLYCSKSACQRQRKTKNREAHKHRLSGTAQKTLEPLKDTHLLETRLKTALAELRALKRRYIILQGAYMAARETGDM